MRNDQSYIDHLLKQYRDGSISAKDRHELERIALNDPFVFDSMEGYALNDGDQSNDAIGRIKSKTTTPQARIINMRSISIAAGIAILIGGLFWVNGQLNQSSHESFSQLEDKVVIEDLEVTSADESLDSAADFAGTKMGDRTVNGAQVESLGNSVDDTDKEATFAIESNNHGLDRTETTEVDNSTPTITVTNDPIERNTANTADTSYEYEYSVNDKATTSEPEVATATPPSAAPATTSARARVTEETVALQKNKVNVVAADTPADDKAKGDDPFGDAPFAQPQFDNQSAETVQKKLQVKDKRLIAGIVRDNTGEPLIGVNILAPNSDIGVATDIDGSFTLEVDSSINQLQIAYVGFTDFVMEIDTTSSYDIVLDDDMAMLDEVVVTGYASNVNDPQPSYVLPPDGRANFKKVVKSKAESGCDQSGKVKLKFTVDRYGELTDFEVRKGLSDACNQRAIDIIKSSGIWDNQFNKDKKVRYTISF